MYKAQPHKRAAKYYKSLDDKTAKRINRAVEEIMKNPREGQHIKKLMGKYEGKYRYEVGGLRIIYRILEDEKVVLIEAIGPRGDIYKQ
jgi:mRNA interferase RelE/StbE